MSDVTDLPRETGSDKSTSTCPTCGTDLPNVQSAYGSVSAGACPKCGKDSLHEAEKALAQGAEDRGYPLGDPSEDWKLDELKTYAGAAGVDLDGVKDRKADVVEAIGDRRAIEPENPQA